MYGAEAFIGQLARRGDAKIVMDDIVHAVMQPAVRLARLSAERLAPPVVRSPAPLTCWARQAAPSDITTTTATAIRGRTLWSGCSAAKPAAAVHPSYIQCGWRIKKVVPVTIGPTGGDERDVPGAGQLHR